MADELDWATPRSRGAVRLVHERDPLLPVSACREAGHFGMGAGQPGARRGGRRGAPEASVRLLLHQIFLALAGLADPAADHQDDAYRVRLSLVQSRVRGAI